MSIETAWVKPPAQIRGLDHLGVQAPCINLYGRLVPGITNVTDRARYYSFYPWIVWALEQAGHKYDDKFIDHFRKADCLFTLIAERHAHVTGEDRADHAAATIGSQNLAEEIAEMKEGKSLRLSDFAHREGGHKYFQNKLGGLGQYYLGVFSELNIMDGTVGSGVRNTNQIGAEIAKIMDKYVDRDLFLKVIKGDVVPPEALDQLSSFCPCHLTNSTLERNQLSDLFLVRGLFSESDMLPRRRTLQLIMYLADELAKHAIDINLDHFRGCTYSGSLPNGANLELPERLQQTRRSWAIYQRNELLSLAAQGIFFVILDSYHESGKRFYSVDNLCLWFLSTPEIELLREVFDLGAPVDEFVKRSVEWLPDLPDWVQDNHEIQLAHRVAALCKQARSEKRRSEILKSSLKILTALISRSETEEGYADFAFPREYFHYYPINLLSLMNHAKAWKSQSLLEWIKWLSSHWGIETHLKVALRKLHGQSQSTFRIRPSELGLEVIAAPEAVFTSPRFNQSLRILKDIGALVKKDRVWGTSDFGQSLKELVSE